jgi:adenylate kinase family enzyme
MRRVLVIGISGAGKSTFARELAARIGLPLIHLDKEFWRPG